MVNTYKFDRNEIKRINSKEGDDRIAITWIGNVIGRINISVNNIDKIHSLEKPLDGNTLNELKVELANIKSHYSVLIDAVNFHSENSRLGIKNMLEKAYKEIRPKVSMSYKKHDEVIEWFDFESRFLIS